ncbi:hypothetical protein [Pseudanabaena minima]|uniref:hypothetical protein n=1 Tax=Pseudanabaena minima TaxID=890415 RepID=UPI003DA863BC
MTRVSLYKLPLLLKQRSPLTTHKPDRLSLQIKQRAHPHPPQTRSPKSQNQTVIAPSPTNTRSLIPSNQIAIN